MIEFARNEWERAVRTIRSGQMLASTDPDSGASRAYYAAYHAVTALFALRGQSFTKHTALRAALHRDLVKTGEWPSDYGQDFDFLLDLRETGDYGGLAHVSEQDVLSALAATKRIMDAVAAAQPELADSGRPATALRPGSDGPA